jgi:SAM-dependent methyltransferase
MDDSGRYTGFDVSRDAINWCRTHVAPRRSGFEFVHADVHNREYNPSGSVAATAYRFPSDDESIDCVVATSVLTHLGADEVSHYLREIRRVLAPGGRAVLTWFIIDDSAARVMEERRAAFRFDIRLPVGFTIDARTPERAVAFTEDEVYRLLGQAGLAVVPPIHFGSWSHHENALDGQDITVVKRSANGNQEP